jgi:hypothetical protein
VGSVSFKSVDTAPYQLEAILLAFCRWSKVADWREGTKQQFIKNDWQSYINEFLKAYHSTQSTQGRPEE